MDAYQNLIYKVSIRAISLTKLQRQKAVLPKFGSLLDSDDNRILLCEIPFCFHREALHNQTKMRRFLIHLQ